MKRLLIIAASIITFSLSASAQWYLFPIEEKEEQKTAEEQKTVETQKATEAQEPEIRVIVDDGEILAATDTVEQAIRQEEEFVLDIPETIKVTLLLPVQLSGKTNTNFVDMYAGALLAARDLGNEGLKIELSAFDSSDESGMVTEEILAGSDIILGPVSPDDMMRYMESAPDKFFVSPLEPKSAALADSSYVVQAPSSAYDQVDELVAWLLEETVAGDDVVLLKDTVSSAITEQSAYLIQKLEESGLRFKTAYLASNINPSSIGNTRFVIASDRDSFIATAARQIGLSSMKRKKDDLFIYGTSKLRNANGLEAQYLYMTNARITMTYAIDYSDEKVKDFILAYRALYKDEPAAFAFQGYDTMHYFVKACARYGRQWYKKLPEYSERGLQSNFRFDVKETAGNVNKAVRRVAYNRSTSITVQ